MVSDHEAARVTRCGLAVFGVPFRVTSQDSINFLVPYLGC